MIDFLTLLFEFQHPEPHAAGGAPWAIVYAMGSFILLLCAGISRLFYVYQKKDGQLQECMQARVARSDRVIDTLEKAIAHEPEDKEDEAPSGTP